MPDILARMPDHVLIGVYRVAKTKLRVWFADPKQMMQLRDEMVRRGLMER